MVPNNESGGLAFPLEAPASTGSVEQKKAASGEYSEGRESKDKSDGGSVADQMTGFSGRLGSSETTSGGMEAPLCMECSIIVVVEEVELEPSAAGRLPSSARLFVTVSAFLPFLVY